MSSHRNNSPQKLPSALKQFLQQSKSPQKYILFGIRGTLLILGVLLIMLGFQGFRTIRRRFYGGQLIIAAGNNTGSSYIFSQAFAEVVERHSSINIVVCETDGTDDNIRALENEPLVDRAICGDEQPTHEQKADLITAQADRLYYSLTSQGNGQNSADLPAAASARAIAILYEDRFQLVVDPSKVNVIDPENFDLSRLYGTTIGTPEAGGQRASLNTLSRHFGFAAYDALETNPRRVMDRLDALFRVRRLGNSEIQYFVEQGWTLVAIRQASALKDTKYPAYKLSSIPQGSYQGSPPIPPTDLETIGVERLLIANEKVSNWKVEVLTRILFEQQQEIRQAIVELSAQPNLNLDFDPEAVIPLVDDITEPSDDSIVQTHQGAAAFYYRPQVLPFVLKNADSFALLLSVMGTLAAFLYQLYLYVTNRQTNVQIEEVVKCMQDLPNSDEDEKYSNDPNYLQDKLKTLFKGHVQLNKTFENASSSLDYLGFRAFSEAYKSVREMMERDIENRQRKFSSLYVRQIVEYMSRVKDETEDPVKLSKELDDTFLKASKTLTEERIFSRESFQTFSEAYDIAREAIERKKKERKKEEREKRAKELRELELKSSFAILENQKQPEDQSDSDSLLAPES